MRVPKEKRIERVMGNWKSRVERVKRNQETRSNEHER